MNFSSQCFCFVFFFGSDELKNLRFSLVSFIQDDFWKFKTIPTESNIYFNKFSKREF